MGPQAIANAKAMAALELAQLKSIGLTREQIMGIRDIEQAWGDFTGLAVPSIEDVDKALVTLNKTTETTGTTIPDSLNKVATSTSALANRIIVLKTKVAEHKITTAQFNAEMIKLRSNYGAAYDAANREADTLIARSGYLVPLTKTQEEYNKKLQESANILETMPAKYQYLDASLQPIRTSFNLLVSSGKTLGEVLDQANTNLNASGSGLSNWQAGINSANDQLKEFLKTAEQNRAGMDVWRTGLDAAIARVAKTFGEQWKPNAAYTIDQLKQLYEAALQGKGAFDTYNEGLKKTNMALWETGKAAEVAYGKLIPSSHGIPKGGRSGKMRIRSDYVQPLIGSPQAQLQMIRNQRPDVYARGSAKLAKEASKIKIGDEMQGQAVKTKSAVTNINQAFNNITTLPAVKQISAVTTATPAM